jgi:hypothetical protein
MIPGVEDIPTPGFHARGAKFVFVPIRGEYPGCFIGELNGYVQLWRTNCRQMDIVSFTLKVWSQRPDFHRTLLCGAAK